MTADEARVRVGEIRAGIDRAMRALCRPGPDWGRAVDALIEAASEADDLAMGCLDEKVRRTTDGDR